MRILFISPSFYPATYYGGPIFSLYNLARCLAKNGFTVFVSTTNRNGIYKLNIKSNRYIALENNLNVKYYGISSHRGFSLWMYLSLWNDIIKKDLIYLVSIFSPPTPLVLFLNIFFNKPLILSPRGQLGEWCIKQGNSLKKLWLKIFIEPVANKITWEATSHYEKEMIHKIYPKATVEIIPSIVDYDEFSNGFNSTHSFSIYEKLTGKNFIGKKIIISLGRIHKVKGFDILIEALKVVQIEYPNAILFIAGEDFGERKKLEQMVKNHNLTNRVFFVGNIKGKDKIEFLRNADLFALASHHENFGMVYAEALSAGIPIVASKNTPWQLVEYYNCGKWVDNNPNEFASAIKELLGANRIALGKSGQRCIQENFSMGVVIQKYRNLFKNMQI